MNIEIFLKLLDSVDGSVIVIDLDGRIEYTNQYILDILGGTPEELKGRMIFDLIPEDLARARKENLKEVIETGNELTVSGNLKGRQMKVTMIPFHDGNGDVEKVGMIARDETERSSIKKEYTRTRELMTILADSFPDGAIVAYDGDMRYFFARGRGLEETGLSPEMMEGKTIREVFPEETVNQILEDYKAAVQGKTSKREVEYQGKIFSTINKPLRDEKGILIGGLTITQDITLQRHKEDELRKTLLFLSEAQRIAGIGNWEWDIGTGTLKVSDGIYRILGLDSDRREPFEMSELIQFVHPDEREKFFSMMQSAIQDRKHIKSKWRILRRNGEIIHVESDGEMQVDGNDDPIRVLGTIQDVTESVRIENELIESRRKYRNIVDSSPMGIYIYELNEDDDLIFSGANKAADRIVGVNNSQFIGKRLEDAFPPLAGTEVPDRYREAALNGTSWSTKQINYDDERITGAFEVYAFQTEPRKMVAMFLDITDRLVAEEALKEREENYRLIVENQTDLVVKVDTEGKFRYISPSYCKVFGLEEGELIGKTYIPMVHEDDRKTTEIAMRDLYREPYSCYVEQRARTVEGWRWLAWSDSSILDENGNVIEIIGVGRDITERKRVQEALEESERRMKSIFRAAPVGIGMVVEREFRFVNDNFCDMLGYDKDELLGKNARMIYHTQEDYEYVGREKYRQIKEKGTGSVEISLLRKNGTSLDVLMSSTPIDRDDWSKGVIFTSLDITERKNAEIQVEKERNRAELYLDLLSHDLGNIHQGIISWVRLYKSHGEDPEFTGMCWEKVSELSGKSIQLTRNIKLISRLNEREPEMEIMDLKTSIVRSLERARNLDPSKLIEVDLDFPDSDIEILAEPLMDEIFFNIIHNGIKFQEEDVWISIGVMNTEDGIRVDIADKGPGIPDDFKKMIFERTERGSEHRHMGIGLSLVKELVSRYKGNIEVRDRVEGRYDGGSIFSVEFPLSGTL